MVKSISKDEKHKLEEKAVDTLLNEALFDNDFKNLWLEYENKTTKEAVFVKEVDKLEPILQSIAYGVKPKNSFKAAVTGLILINVFGVTVSSS